MLRFQVPSTAGPTWDGIVDGSLQNDESRWIWIMITDFNNTVPDNIDMNRYFYTYIYIDCMYMKYLQYKLCLLYLH